MANEIYQILDIRDKKELEDKIAQITGGSISGGIVREIVETLPGSGNESTIYMVGPKSGANGNNIYEEYMFINGTPELIGSTAVDMSGYVETKDAIVGLSVSGQTITYTKGDGSTGTIKTQDTNTTYSVATTDKDGLMSAEDKIKLDNQVGLKTEDGGEIFNDYENNVALTPYSTASGTKTQAGACGYHFTKLEHQGFVYPVICIPKRYEFESEVLYEVDNINYSVGDILNIDANSHQYEIFRVTNINSSDSEYHKITVEFVERTTFGYNSYTWNPVEGPMAAEDANGNYAFGDLKLASDAPNENWVWCTQKPTVGFPIPAFEGNIVAGKNNKALGYSTAALGRDNKAVGNHSIVSGRRSEAVGYVSFASGYETQAIGFESFTQGYHTVAIGDKSVALNFHSKTYANNSLAGGDTSVAEVGSDASFVFGNGSHTRSKYSAAIGDGVYTRTDLDGHIVLGKFNRITNDYTTDNTIFAIGNGTSHSNRSNAFEVKENGYAYIFNGTTKLISDDELTAGLAGKPGVLYNDNYIFGNSTSTITGLGNAVFGANNQVTGGAVKTFVAGDTNIVSANFAGSIGIRNTTNHYASMTFGDDLTTSDFRQVVVGWCNDTEGTSNARFVVGNGYPNGDGTSTYSTAFRVMQDGTAWLQTQGDLDNSVVIKETLDNLIGVGASIDEAVSENKFFVVIDN